MTVSIDTSRTSNTASLPAPPSRDPHQNLQQPVPPPVQPQTQPGGRACQFPHHDPLLVPPSSPISRIRLPCRPGQPSQTALSQGIVLVPREGRPVARDLDGERGRGEEPDARIRVFEERLDESPSLGTLLDLLQAELNRVRLLGAGVGRVEPLDKRGKAHGRTMRPS